MKRISFLLAVALSGATLTAQTTTTNQTGPATLTTTNAAADRDWQEFEAYVRERGKKPEELGKLSPSQQLMARETVLVEISARAIEFYEKHPTDPQRWLTLETIRRAMPQFIKEIKPGYDQNQKDSLLVKDEAAKAARKKLLADLEAARDMATDVPEAMREVVAGRKLLDEMSKAAKWDESGDWQGLESRVDAFEAEFHTPALVSRIERDYLELLKTKKPAAAELRQIKALQSPVAAIKAYAESQRLLQACRSTPMEMTFTALDGRIVDLAKLRGKVVLIDFWAIWCGPCIAELPNVKAAYEKYHAQGFEVVGISLDKQEDRQKLVDLVAKQSVPWPQFFDGRGWKNELAVKYGIHAIPATFLLDREGKIVSTSVRGAALESEVARLLAK